MKQLTFLLCGEARDKSAFMRPVTGELVQIPVKSKTTFAQVNNSLEELYKDCPEELESAKAWIKSQENTCVDVEKMEVLDVIPEPGINMFMIFELKEV